MDIQIDCGSIYYGLKQLKNIERDFSAFSSAMSGITLPTELETASLLTNAKNTINSLQENDIKTLIERFEETKSILIASDEKAALLFGYYDQGIIDENGNFTDVPLLTQNDYDDIPYGNGTVATSGCGITSLCMIASYILGELYTPEDLAAIANADKSSNVGKMTTAADYVNLNWFNDPNTSREDLAQYLKEGKLVICLVKGSSHFVVCKGITPDGKILVNDPYLYFRKPEYNDGYTWGELEFSAGNTWIFDPAANTGAKTSAGTISISASVLEQLDDIEIDGVYEETIEADAKDENPVEEPETLETEPPEETKEQEEPTEALEEPEETEAPTTPPSTETSEPTSPSVPSESTTPTEPQETMPPKETTPSSSNKVEAPSPNTTASSSSTSSTTSSTHTSSASSTSTSSSSNTATNTSSSSTTTTSTETTASNTSAPQTSSSSTENTSTNTTTNQKGDTQPSTSVTIKEESTKTEMSSIQNTQEPPSKGNNEINNTIPGSVNVNTSIQNTDTSITIGASSSTMNNQTTSPISGNTNNYGTRPTTSSSTSSTNTTTPRVPNTKVDTRATSTNQKNLIQSKYLVPGLIGTAITAMALNTASIIKDKKDEEKEQKAN